MIFHNVNYHQFQLRIVIIIMHFINQVIHNLIYYGMIAINVIMVTIESISQIYTKVYVY